jgi:hypothetical protein
MDVDVWMGAMAKLQKGSERRGVNALKVANVSDAQMGGRIAAPSIDGLLAMRGAMGFRPAWNVANDEKRSAPISGFLSRLHGARQCVNDRLKEEGKFLLRHDSGPNRNVHRNDVRVPEEVSSEVGERDEGMAEARGLF